MSSLVDKLKEGLQDAVVFLRTLEQFRIPPVVERRRKELLEKLVHLQGDTLREEPPRFEPVDEEEEKAKQLKRTDSKVGDRVKEIEDVDAPSKPKDAKSQKPQEQTGKGDKEVGGKKAKETAEGGASALTSVEQAASEGGNELTAEQTSTGGSCENLNKLEEKEKKKGLGFRFRRRGKDRDKSEKRAVSPARPESQIDDEIQKEEPSKEPSKQEPEEEKEASVDDEDVKLKLQLERKVTKRFGGHQWQKMNVSLKEFTLFIGNRDKVDLVGCTITTTDAGFDLCSHPEHKTFIFRSENAEAKEKCVSTLQAAIDECTPAPSELPEQPAEDAVNGKQEEVPKITVQDEEEPPTDITEERQPGDSESQANAKKKKESRAAPAPKLRKLPDQGVQMKGHMFRKTWKGWEKCWCVLTYNALYFTGVEESGEYSHMLAINQEESGGSIKEKKGHDKQSKGLIIKPNKKSKSETVSIDSSEFTQWYRQLEQVIGISGVEELLSEDEGEVEPIDEELYEEVDLPPPIVPASPRPPRAPLTSSVPVADDFQDMGGEEIYEEFDDPLDAVPEAVSPQQQAPTLPSRNPTKIEPAPALPARNVPPAKNGSPARSTKLPIPAKSKFVSDVQEYEVASPPARTKVGIPARPPPPPTAPTTAPIADEDDTYDDIVGVMGQDDIEEAYDDVVTPIATETNPDRSRLMSEENYEDMAPGEDGPTEDYVIMEPGEGDDEGDLYLEVDDDKPPAYALAQRRGLANQQKNSSPKTGTFSKIFGGVKGKPGATAAAAITRSQLSYKAPKKTKFSDEWCAVEGSSLQFFKSSTDKKPREKLSINEFDLKIGSTEAGVGDCAFRLTKGDKVHHFSVKTKEELDGWVAALKVITKSASIDLGDSVFQAKEDHIGEGEDQLTFKKGTYIRLITQTSGDMWIGQIGSDAQVFNGKIGKFPTSKAALVEDLYV